MSADDVAETNLAPKGLMDHMIATPMETLIRAVVQLTVDSSLSGKVAEVHGDNVTIHGPQAWVDEDSKKNLEMFWTLGMA